MPASTKTELQTGPSTETCSGRDTQYRHLKECNKKKTCLGRQVINRFYTNFDYCIYTFTYFRLQGNSVSRSPERDVPRYNISNFANSTVGENIIGSPKYEIIFSTLPKYSFFNIAIAIQYFSLFLPF